MTQSAAAAPTKRTPIRTCVACRTSGGKRGLLRIVRLPDAQGVALDPTGKRSGRGAYVCPTDECIGLALKQKKLERSLKTPIPEALASDLRAAAAAAVQEKASTPPSLVPS